jgi:hypothetical protein
MPVQPCGEEHEGPCVSFGDALFAAADKNDTIMLFGLLHNLDTEELDRLVAIGNNVAASAEAMKAVQASTLPGELSQAMALITAMMSGAASLPEKPEDVNAFLESLGLSAEDGQEPAQG